LKRITYELLLALAGSSSLEGIYFLMPALYSLYRPKVFSEVVSQDHIVFSLTGSLRRDNVSHAYLFSGPRGTGKTTLARLLAASVNCKVNKVTCGACESCLAIQAGSYQDVVEIDAASNRGIADIRNLRDRITYLPIDGRYKVYILDEIHQLTAEASNALLKTLEEPPSHIIFVLCTTEIQKVLSTIRSRCQIHKFRLVPEILIVHRLKQIVIDQKCNVPEDTVEYISRQADGSIRDALSLLDVILGLEDRSLEKVQRMMGRANYSVVGDFVECLAERSKSKVLRFINLLYDDQMTDIRLFREDVVAWLRGLLYISVGITFSHPLLERMKRQAMDFDFKDLTVCLEAFTTKLDNDLLFFPQLILELPSLDAIDRMTPLEDF